LRYTTTVKNGVPTSAPSWVKLDGEADHVHLLVNFPPTVALSRLVNSLKGVSSRRLRQESPTWPGISGGPGGCGRSRTSQARPEVLG